MSEMVERCAKAMYDHDSSVLSMADRSWDDETDLKKKDAYRAAVRVVVAAMRRPSEAMCDAAYNVAPENTDPNVARWNAPLPVLWQAMIDEALK